MTSQASQSMSGFHMWAAGAATAFGYGVALPALPQALAQGGLEPARTGYVMATYSMAVLVAAPLWGRACHRWPAAHIVRVGLLGQMVALLLHLPSFDIALLVGARALLGVSAAAALVGLLTQVAEPACDGSAHEQRLSHLSRAAIIGGLFGPAIGGLVSTGPTLGPAGAAGAAAMAVAWALHARFHPAGPPAEPPCRPASATGLRQFLLMALAALAAATMAMYEVGLATRGREALALSTREVGAMFAGCGIMMLLVQTIVFRRGHDPLRTFRWVAPGFLAMALALVLIGQARGASWAWVGLVLVAAAAGVLQPALAYWAGRAAGPMASAGRGLRTAFTTCGQALGSLTGAYAFSPTPTGRLLLGAITIVLAGAATVAFVIRRRPTSQT